MEAPFEQSEMFAHFYYLTIMSTLQIQSKSVVHVLNMYNFGLHQIEVKTWEAPT